MISLENLTMNNKNNNIIEEKYGHCKNCGAILENNKCEYCGTEYISINKFENNNEDNFCVRGGIGNKILNEKNDIQISDIMAVQSGNDCIEFNMINIFFTILFSIIVMIPMLFF